MGEVLLQLRVSEACVLNGKSSFSSGMLGLFLKMGSNHPLLPLFSFGFTKLCRASGVVWQIPATTVPNSIKPKF
jgi:hypothetical protein